MPKLTWWRENSLLDDSYEISTEQQLSSTLLVSNTLTVDRLERGDLHARFTCQAANSNISVPVSTTVTLDMSCKLENETFPIIATLTRL